MWLKGWADRLMMQCESLAVRCVLRFLPKAVFSKVRFLKQYLGDLMLGINSAQDVSYDKLGFDANTGYTYTPGNWWDLKGTLGYNVSREDVFIDFGSGKGRMVYVAARNYHFKKVIGVEKSEDLCAIARSNIRKNLHRLKCRNVELISTNVLDYEVPDDVSIVYMYNPFAGAVFADTIGKLNRSLTRHPRKLRLIYRNPTMHDLLVQNGFQVERQLPELTLYVAGLSRSPTVSN
ncbi:MAG: class I SAM-dependent methyltransferase [Dehalococcoidales bacterium]|nr:class I SAM-dependent methyltransferase [Dehalococcoidales bacterium]